MIILSVDYGDKRTGIAVCDKFEMLASPVCVITEWNIDTLANKIIDVAREKKAEEIVVGLPKNMDGSEGNRAEVTREFGNLLLENNENIKIVYQDERLSSVEAEDILLEANVKRDKRKQLIDQIAAQIILQSYLDSVKK